MCVCAQRLGRVLCTHCRSSIEYPEERLIELGFHSEELTDLELFQANPSGCPRCTGGYKGRFALLETLSMDNELKRLVIEGKSAAEIKTCAREKGMLTLRRVGLLNAMRGKTSIEEVLRVTMSD